MFLDMSGALRIGFHDLLIALHLESHAEARRNTSSEFIIALTPDLRGKNCFDETLAGQYPQVLGPTLSLRPQMAAMEVQTK